MLDELATGRATVTGGKLDLNIRTADKAINITHIVITAEETGTAVADYTYLSGEEPAVPKKEDKGDVTDATTANVPEESTTAAESDKDVAGKDVAGDNKKPGVIIGIAVAAAAVVAGIGAVIFKKRK